MVVYYGGRVIVVAKILASKSSGKISKSKAGKIMANHKANNH